MSKPKVSVIVPVYRAECYLEKCVESLIVQTLSDIEIILVDDGSPDKSGEIADAFAAKDSRIQVRHKENGGLGSARNAGICIATGEYVAFLDSDDWVKPVMYENLYREASIWDADIVVSGHCDVAEDTVVLVKPHPMARTRLCTHEEIAAIRLNLFGVGLDDGTVEAFPMSACMSLYRTEMVRNQNLSFPNTISEDTIFNLQAYQCARRISFIADVNYCYRKEEQASLTNAFAESKLGKYRDFLTLLRQMASLELDPEAQIRAARTAIDSCRMYMGLVDNAKISMDEKIRHARAFSLDDEIRQCWEGYPIDRLPATQRLFHVMVEHEQYFFALLLCRLRKWLKKVKQIINGIK